MILIKKNVTAIQIFQFKKPHLFENKMYKFTLIKSIFIL